MKKTYSVSLDVRHHQMTFQDFCGPAVAQMILASIGLGMHQQLDLWPETPDGVTPEGLVEVLNGKAKPNSFLAPKFEFFKRDWKDCGDASRFLAWIISELGMPPAVLINGHRHWVVVHGYEANCLPREENDNKVRITAFECHDPSPEIFSNIDPGDPDAAEVDQHTNDPHDGCETHDAYPSLYSYDDWEEQTNISLPNQDPSHVAVYGTPIQRFFQRLSLVHLYVPEHDFVQQELPDIALEALRQLATTKKEPWRTSLERARHNATLHVKRIDRKDSDYVLVVFDKTPTGTTLAVRMKRTDKEESGGESKWRQASILRGRFADVLTNFDADRLLGRKKPANTPTLVWRRCDQSSSPLLPFLQADSRYIRLDGVEFNRLTVAGKPVK